MSPDRTEELLAANRALRESEERFRTLTEISADFFWETDAAHRCTAMEFGSAYRGSRALGAKLGKTRWEIPPASPGEAEWNAHRAEIAAYRRFVNFGFSRIEDGAERFYEESGAPRFGPQGEFLGYRGIGRDVTERKRAELALRASEARFRSLTELSSDFFWETDTEHRYTAIELGWAYTGVRNSPSKLGFRRWEIAYTSPDEAGWAAHRAAIAARERFVDFRFSRIEEGGERFYEHSGEPRYDPLGNFLGYRGVGRDVTARKRAEDALRESEQRYELAMAASESGYWDWHIPTSRYFASARANELAGFETENTFADRADFRARMPMHPEDSARWEAAREDLFAGTGERLAMECRYIVRGETRWHSLQAICRRDDTGKVVRWTGSATDITERKRAEGDLRASEARFRGLTALSSDWYWEQDENLRFTYLSAQADDLTGYSGESSIGKTRWELENMTPLSCTWAEHQAMLAARQPFRELECARVGADGVLRYISMGGEPLFDEQGRFTGYHGIGRDITERKRAEEKLRESEALKSAMFETALDCIISIDHDGRVIEFNPAAERTFGYRRAEVMGKKLAELIIPPRLSEQHRRGLARYLATGEGPVLGTRVEIPAVRADGAEFPVELSVTRIPGEGAPLFTAYLRDITERKRAEEKLRESEARFRSLTEISSDWYWRQDENLRFTYLSEGVSERAGWPADDYLGRLRWEVPDIHPVSCSWEEHKEVLAKRQPFRDLEYWRPGKDGLILYSSISGAPIFDEQGRFKGYQGVGRNITERKRIEEELRSRQEMLELAQKSARAIAFEWRIGADGPDHKRWSPELAAMYGAAPESYDGSFEQWKKLVHPEDWPAVKEAIKHATRTGDVSTEYRVVHPDGSVHWLQAKGRMFFDAAGKPARMVGFMHDVTERKRADEALRQSEGRFALAVAGSNEGIFDWDLASDRVYVSHRAQELFGLPRGELWRPRRDWRHIVAFHPDDAPRLHDSIKAHIEGGAPTYDEEFRIVLPSGGVRWFRQRGIALRDASGKAYRMVGSIGDVTERHKAEEELSSLERQLRMAQRLEAMGTLAGGIAHDFNNILGAILGFSEMAWRDAPKGSRLQRDLESIATAGERGRALVDRILAFSRSGVGERVAVHVEKVVREVLDLLSAKLPPSVILSAELRAGRAALLGDPTQVHQVLMNLGTNAVQAMPSGGTLRVSLDVVRCAAARAATVGKVAAADYVVLRVADSGSGIAPEILERIFDPFFTTKEMGTGTGLGLSLVHGIVTELGGAIDLESAPGKGAAFTVYLPRAGDALDSSQQEETELPRGGGQRVLVVDDEEPLVRLATRTLEELGYRPVGFTSSAAALAAFCADPGRFDALIADERMPGLSGTALIREVRGVRRAIPALLMSGYVGGALASLAREAGADDVLKKPVLARDLATSLARVLQQ